MQNERRRRGSGNVERKPSRVTVTISPGSTSRTYSAPMRSKAQVSEAKTQAELGPMFGVKVYGADWCEDTQHTRQFLERLGVSYEYVNIERDESARAWVREQNGGRERKPTVN